MTALLRRVHAMVDCVPERHQTRAAHPTRWPRAGPKSKAGVDTGGKERGGNEAAGKEKYGRDPRSGSALSGEPGAGWAVPATGSLGQIASLPELVAALAAAEGRSKKKKLVVVKFYAPWCSSCKVRQVRVE